MEIGKEINQGKFKSEWQKVNLNILFTSYWIQNQVKEILKDYDLTNQQFNVLRILRGTYPNPLSNTIIRNRMLDKMSDVSRILVRLQEKELIIKQDNGKDRRASDITISPKGLKLLESIDVKETELEGISKNLSEEEARLLNNLCDKLRDKK